MSRHSQDVVNEFRLLVPVMTKSLRLPIKPSILHSCFLSLLGLLQFQTISYLLVHVACGHFASVSKGLVVVVDRFDKTLQVVLEKESKANKA